MSDNRLFFIYDDLYETHKQLSVFGRTIMVDGTEDYINNWNLIKLKMRGVERAILVHGGENDLVMGALINMPKNLIPILDNYYGKEYQKMTIRTLAGQIVNVYTKRYDIKINNGI